MNLLLLEVDLQQLGIEAYFIKVDWRSGSGWLSILFQLGALGAIIMLFILKKVTRVLNILNMIRRFTIVLLFLYFFCVCILVFEGYLLTVGLLYRFCILASNFSYNMLSGYGEEVQIKF